MKKFLLLVLFCSLLACESNRIYEQNNTLDSRYWRAEDPQIFTFEITDDSSHYNVYYNIRNSLDYPFARLFIEYTLADSTGTELKKSLTSEYLFDQKTGRPLGESGIGDVFDHQFKIIDNYQFQYAGKYQLILKQFNRADTLVGVLAVGARVETMPTE